VAPRWWLCSWFMWRPYHDGRPNDLISGKAYHRQPTVPPVDIDIEIQGGADIQDRSQVMMNLPAGTTSRVTSQPIPETGAPGIRVTGRWREVTET